MEIDNIYNMDCLEGMKQIPDGTIDAVICDLPYGTMKTNNPSEAWSKRKQCDWDEVIPTAPLFAEYARVLRRGGACILFSAEPYTSHLRTFKERTLDFLYPMYWLKDSPGNHLIAKNAPVSFVEDINVFRKSNPIVRDMNSPLREYVRKLIKFIGKTGTQVKKDIIEWGIDAPNTYRSFFSPDAEWLFMLVQEYQYDIIIERYHINEMEGFLPWSECKRMWDESNIGKLGDTVFNLPEGQGSLSNVLEFSKDTDGFHPTQKPVALIRRLVLTYTNEGDTVLDNCMGSGTTAIACIKERRHFIGFELSKEYFDKAVRRIKAEQAQLTLF
jgi:site-specific DNA-methyltransferase (adenine-specific)